MQCTRRARRSLKLYSEFTLYKRLISLILFIFIPALTSAQGQFDYLSDPDWRFRLNFGLGLWPAQESLDSGTSGEFDAGPLVLEFGGDYRIAKWGDHDLYLGLDAGLMSTQSDIPGRFTSPTSDVSYFLPSFALYRGDYDAPRLNLRAGVGRYRVEFSELVDTTSINRTFSASEFGYFVGLGIDFPLSVGSGLNSITLESRAHFVDFGEVERLGSLSQNLNGPIWTLQIGWSRRF